jgi:pimeloyl-ACP methyl ester carboxylesterase
MKLHHRDYGSGKTALIIMHGLFGNLNNWHSLANEIGEVVRVVTVDQRNHGKSPHSDHFNYVEMAADIEELTTDLGIEQAIVMGHSMGAKTAMYFTMQHPDKTAGLIAVDMAPRQYDHLFEEIFHALTTFDPSIYNSRTAADAAFAELLPGTGVRQFLLQNLERDDAGGFTWRMNLPVLHRDYNKIASGVAGDGYEGPALFLRGAESGYVKDEDMEVIQAFFPAAELVTIARAGHWVHADNPTDLKQEVIRFVAPIVQQ